MQNADLEQEVIHLSKEKWRWMSECNTEALDALFHEKSVFVHMGGAWGKAREMEIIKSGGIHYKKAEIHEVSVNVIGATAVLLNRITLLAVVGGNEVTNPVTASRWAMYGVRLSLRTWLACRRAA